MLSLEQLEDFLAKARGAGWSVSTKPNPSLALAGEVASRYPVLPPDYELFLSHVAHCVNAGENAWFLTEADYNAVDVPENTFRWNEWERLCLEWLYDDAEACARTSKFWREHLPIMSAVHSDYAYIAIRMADGAVVYGVAPDFDEPSDVCASFGEYLSTLGDYVAGGTSALGDTIEFAYADFM